MHKSPPKFGYVDGERLYALDGHPFDHDVRPGALVGSVNDVTLLPPTVPSKIICLGRNYVAHAQEKGNKVPDEPLLFLKPPSSLFGHQAAIELLPEMGHVEHEAELAVIIGEGGRDILLERALEAVLGYSCANDVSERDYQSKDGQWTRAKGFDTFCPLGPWINTDSQPGDLVVQCSVNGVVRQCASNAQMVFDIPTLVSHISRIMTLLPGDVILTGTPAGVGPIQPGDQVKVEIDGIGSLLNSVKMRA